MFWLPLAIAGFALVRRFRPTLAPHALVLTSTAFCLVAGPISLLFLAASVGGNFLAMQVLLRMEPGSRARKVTLAAAIVANLTPLAAFKLFQQSGWPWDPAVVSSVVLPLGLAFYTLQQITFLVEGLKPGAERLGFIRFAAWGSFFGQLPAGPIGAWSRMAPQFARLGLNGPGDADIARGLALVLMGFNKKLWLADPIGRRVDSILIGANLGSITPLEAWTLAWGYMLQLYFDFSAYSDIAIGIGLCFGLLLPINFNSPLKSATPGQYVMRWHISLMTFARDFVFEPVFRVARKLPIQPTTRRYAIAWALATLVSYLAVAAWHTVAPITLLQGSGVALLLIGLQFVRQTSRAGPRSPGPVERGARRLGGQVLLLIGVSVIALLLRTHSGDQFSRIVPALLDGDAVLRLVGDATASLSARPGFGSPAAWEGLYPNARLPGMRTLAVIGMGTVIALTCPNTMQIFGLTAPAPAGARLVWRPSAVWGLLTAALLFAALFGLTRPVPVNGFIYAQF